MRGAWPWLLATLACAEIVPEPVQSRVGALGTLVVLELPSRESADGARGQIIRGGRWLEAIDEGRATLVLGYAETPEQLGWTEGAWAHDARARGRLRAPQALWAPDATSTWSDAESHRGDRALRALRFPVPDGELCARGEGCLAADPAAPGARWCAPCDAPAPAAPTPPRPPDPGACGMGWSLAAIGGAEDTAELRAVQLCDAPSADCADVAQRHHPQRGCIALGPPCPSASAPWAPTPSGRVRWVAPTGRTDGAGDAAAPWSLAHALEAAEPDETLLLARGAYSLPADTRLTRASRWFGACAAETQVTTTGTLTVAAPLELVGLALNSPALALTPEAALTASGLVLETRAVDVPRGAHLALDDAHVDGPGDGVLAVQGQLVAADTDLSGLGLRVAGGEVTLRDVQSRDGTGLRVTEGATLTGQRVRLQARGVVAALDVSGSALVLESSAVTTGGATSALRVTGGTATVARTWLRGEGGQGAVTVSGARVTLRDLVANRTLRVNLGGHLEVERVVVTRAAGHALRATSAQLRARDLVVEGSKNALQVEEGSHVAIERAHFRRLERRGVEVPGAVTSVLELTDVTMEQLGSFGISADRAEAVTLRRVAIRDAAGAAIVGDALTMRVLDAEDLDIADTARTRTEEDCEGVSCTGVGLRLGGPADGVSLRRFRITGYEAQAISVSTAMLELSEGYIGAGPIGLDAPRPEPEEYLNVQNLATEAWGR